MLSDTVKKLVERRGFARPTEIQQKAFPLVESGKNCLIVAPTGYGKTEAVLLPLFDKIRQNKKFGVQLLYITPLRALNRDMLERITWWARELGITLGVRHGDTSTKERVAQSKLPPQILITTPESLQAMLCAPKMGAHLLQIDTVVIDEIHELFADKRGAQLAIGLERLVEKKKAAGLGEFQRVGLSATVGDAKEVVKFLCGRRECEVAALSALRRMELRVHSPTPAKEDAELAESLFIDSTAVARLRLLERLLKEKKTLVFVNTRSVAEILSSRLLKLEADVGVHHGSLAKEARIATEKEFKESLTRGLIATSSLELGIDIGSVERVVQFMSPRQVQRLVQRVGRSGHAVEKTPRGEIIASDPDDILESAVIAERAAKGELEKEKMQENALDVLANQLSGIALDWGAVELKRVLEIVRRAGPYLNLGEQELLDVALQLKSERIFRFDEEAKVIEKGANTRAFYYLKLSMIPSEKKFMVKNAATNKVLGSLDEGFAMQLEPGARFITKGVPWKVLDIGMEEIVVEPSDTFDAAIPDWEGEEIPVPFEVASQAAALRARVAEGNLGGLEKIVERNALEKAAALFKSQSPLPDDKTVLIECVGEGCVIHVAGGSLANAAIAKALAAKLTQKFGASVRADNDAYRILLVTPQPLRAEEVKTLLAGLGNVGLVLDAYLPRTSIFRYKFVHVARAFGLVGEHSRMSSRFVEKLSKTPIFKETLREVNSRYLDARKAGEILGWMRDGRLKVICRTSKDFTPLGRLALERVKAGELVAPIEPASEILKAFKESIVSQSQRFMCTYCGKVHFAKLKELPAQPTCPYCWSTMIAPIYQGEEKVWKKDRWKRGKEEEKKAAGMSRMASLMTSYGKRAAWALAVYGVGAETASRVLAKIIKDENAFFAELLEAQKRFIKTKKYWKMAG